MRAITVVHNMSARIPVRLPAGIGCHCTARASATGRALVAGQATAHLIPSQYRRRFSKTPTDRGGGRRSERAMGADGGGRVAFGMQVVPGRAETSSTAPRVRRVWTRRP
jgi:hypothetical protein